jgi:hypothetical protein
MEQGKEKSREEQQQFEDLQTILLQILQTIKGKLIMKISIYVNHILKENWLSSLFLNIGNQQNYWK